MILYKVAQASTAATKTPPIPASPVFHAAALELLAAPLAAVPLPLADPDLLAEDPLATGAAEPIDAEGPEMTTAPELV